MVHSIELLEGPPALAHTTGLAAAAAEVARAAAAAAAGSAAGTSLGRASAQHAAAIESQPALPYYQLPPAVQQQIVLVDSEEGLAHMEQALFPSSSSDGSSCSSRSGSSEGGSSSDTDGEGDGTTTISSSSGGGSAPRGFGSPVSPFRLVVGIDCEWQPYSTRRGDPKTPVSLLQVRSDWLGIMVCHHARAAAAWSCCACVARLRWARCAVWLASAGPGACWWCVVSIPLKVNLPCACSWPRLMVCSCWTCLLFCLVLVMDAC